MTPTQADTVTAGVFLLGVAALTLWQVTLAGLLIVFGLCGLVRAALLRAPLRGQRVAAALIGEGVVLWLEAALRLAQFDGAFPLAAALVGVALIFVVDFRPR